MIRRAVGLSALAVSAAWAQVGPPLLGYLPENGQIRPIYGISAAAAVGEPAGSPRFAQAAASPELGYVVASLAETGRVMLYSEAGLRAVEGAGAGPDAIAVSPRGSAAVLWFASISRAQIVSGLPGDAVVRNVDAPFRPSIPALAVSDDGAWIAGAWGTGLHTFGPHGEMAALPVAGRIGALAFAPGGHDLAVANGEGIHWVTGLDTQAAVSLLFDPADAFRPVGVAVAGGKILAAEQGGALVAVDVATRAAIVTECHCRPEGMFGMGSGVFRLTGLEDGAVRLFDSRSGQVLFAPLALHEGGRP